MNLSRATGHNTELVRTLRKYFETYLFWTSRYVDMWYLENSTIGSR